MPENSQTNDNITKAFEPDYLNRKALVEEWTSALFSTKLNHHLVISVSGDWGTGKTYLAKNWHKYLEEQEYFTCYIDAHKKDYAEDPLLIIMSEIESAVNKYIKKEEVFIKRAFTPVKRKFFPFIASGLKTAGKVGASIVLPDIISSGVKQIIDEVDAETIKEFVKSSIEKYGKKKDNYIKQYYKNIQAYSKNIEEFKQALEKFANTVADKLNKPVVIFIDELDRSNPKFVIKLIEQLKHIFEIPNLVFILTVNKKELSNTIKGIYGSEMDGYAYYKKFTTHDFTLYPIEQLNDDNLKIFIEKTIGKYDNFMMSDDFINISVEIVQSLNLSLRDIEQVLDHLYYIKEKVTQEYHKEYLIIVFLYRAMYVKDYSSFVLYKEYLETLNGIVGNNEISKAFSDTIFYKIFNRLMNNTIDIYISFIIFVCIRIDSNNFEKVFHHINEINGITVYSKDDIKDNLKSLFNPIFKYAVHSLNNQFCILNDIVRTLKAIRKNLIQLSMLGAVPKDNIRK